MPTDAALRTDPIPITMVQKMIRLIIILVVPVIAFLNNGVRVLVAKDPAAEEAAQQDDDGALVQAEPDTVDAGQPQWSAFRLASGIAASEEVRTPRSRRS